MLETHLFFIALSGYKVCISFRVVSKIAGFVTKLKAFCALSIDFPAAMSPRRSSPLCWRNGSAHCRLIMKQGISTYHFLVRRHDLKLKVLNSLNSGLDHWRN